jgi:hypothetical protein
LHWHLIDMTNVFAIALCSTLLAGGLCVAAPAGPPDDLRAALKEPGGFRLHSSISAIPESVRMAFIKLTGQNVFSMAEPGEYYQSTDVLVPGPPLPGRRLGKVALSKSFGILFYERGGIAWTFQVVVFRLSPDGAKLVWSGYSNRTIADPANLLIAIDKGQIHDGFKYY